MATKSPVASATATNVMEKAVCTPANVSCSKSAATLRKPMLPGTNSQPGHLGDRGRSVEQAGVGIARQAQQQGPGEGAKLGAEEGRAGAGT